MDSFPLNQLLAEKTLANQWRPKQLFDLYCHLKTVAQNQSVCLCVFKLVGGALAFQEVSGRRRRERRLAGE